MASSQASTSAPSQPRKELECVVCGKKCWTRCSACGANGTEWMYFCSIEHQQLIWPVHSRFCGVNSSPLRWPLLSDSEADAAREVLRTLRREQSGTSTKAGILKGLGFVEAGSGVTKAQLENVLPHILEASKPSFSMSSQSRSTFVAIFRRETFRIKRRLAESSQGSTDLRQSADWTIQETAQDAVGAVLQLRGLVDQLLLFCSCDSQRWFDILMHKIFTHFAILARYYDDLSRLKKLRPLLQYTREEVERFCEQVVLKINPFLARSIKEALTLDPA